MSQVLDQLLQHGGLIGAILAGAGLAMYKLYNDGQKHQTNRVDDAQKVVKQILELVEKAEASKQALARAIDENTEATRQLANRCPGAAARTAARGG